MEKTCSRCKQKKSEKEFNFRIKNKGILQGRCRDCTREMSRNHYEENKDVYKQRAIAHNKKTRSRNIQRVKEYLDEHPCVDCGETDPVVLQFDHNGDKTKCVSVMLKECYSWDTIQSEIAKCQVRCGNCHTRKTAKERGWKILELQ